MTEDQLLFPVFDEPYCRYLAACGQLKTKSSRLLAKLAKLHEKPTTTLVGKGPRAEYVTLLGNGGEHASKKHVHINVATASYFRVPPKVTASEDEFASLIGNFFGLAVDVRITARFIAPLKLATGSLVGLSSVNVNNKKGIEIRQTGSEFQLKAGGKIDVRFQLRQFDDEMRTEIEMSVPATISERYLQTLHLITYGGFQSLILGDKEHNVTNPKLSRKRKLPPKR